MDLLVQKIMEAKFDSLIGKAQTHRDKGVSGLSRRLTILSRTFWINRKYCLIVPTKFHRESLAQLLVKDKNPIYLTEEQAIAKVREIEQEGKR